METRAFLEVICHSLLQYELQMLEFQTGFSQFFRTERWRWFHESKTNSIISGNCQQGRQRSVLVHDLSGNLIRSGITAYFLWWAGWISTSKIPVHVSDEAWDEPSYLPAYFFWRLYVEWKSVRRSQGFLHSSSSVHYVFIIKLSELSRRMGQCIWWLGKISTSSIT